ncbi:hypothetical protein L207DRAFT_572310 [Hyaloscypha variabilis F]|uniref:Uncharacterized protein n=1 Tax=Hyaloscypha variabilis (strain UAMH 11265 / GT02V1 / F) TaxID=1149755 RepID=A0A2J6R0F6_HYAVF|nr:hypothetical protein L207DRAFT_572310 [Hyaloscypha variabilis F]
MARQATQDSPNRIPLQNGHSGSEKPNTSRPSSFSQRVLKKARAVQTKFTNPWRELQRNRREKKETRKPPKKVAPFTLSHRGLLLLLVFEILIIIAITTIWVLTTKRNGFVDAPDTPTSFTGSQTLHEKFLWGLSLFWTFIPSLIVSLCGALFAATLQALQDCQPTIELSKPASHTVQETSKAKLSILLDYRRYWFPFTDSCHAFRNKHFIISACMVIKWLFVAIGPLASSIISVGNIPSSKSVQVTITKGLDDSTNGSWWSSTRPSFDSTSAILLNNASTLSWSTKIYSVNPFSTESDIAGNLTADTTTYSATLDCAPIDANFLLSVGNVTKDSSDTVYFNFVDRGCEIIASINGFDASYDGYVYSSTSYFNCPYEVNRARLILMTGIYDASSLYLFENFSITSCLPNFWRSRSRVSALWGANTLGDPGRIINIVPDISTVERWWPQFWQAWMVRIPQYQVSDPQNELVEDMFGFIAYSYAKTPNTAIDFVQAMNDTFSVLFATFATSTVYTPLAESISSTGTLSQPGNRLFVVFLPASMVTFVMALSFLATIWIAVYAYQHRLIIKEHVDLILGHAILLDGNDGVSTFIDTVKAGFERQARDAIAAAYAKKAQKFGTVSSLAVDLEVENAVKKGDLVRYVEDFENLKDWDCWVERNGRLRIRAPQLALSSP